MTHDPLCQLGTRKTTTDPEDCHSCDFIAKVRADTLDRAKRTLRELRDVAATRDYFEGIDDSLSSIDVLQREVNVLREKS